MGVPDPHALASTWPLGSPFPHFVLDGIWNDDVLRAAAREFPAPDSGAWHTFTDEREAGKQEASASVAGENVAKVHDVLAGEDFVAWLRIVTGIVDLQPDPTRVGGGIHQVIPGGRLALHVDFNHHPTFDLWRRVNVLLFLNDGWRDEWGGQLMLHHPDRGVSDVVLSPTLGRMVIFEARDGNYHGHPEPLRCPPHVTRKSVPAYYYSTTPPTPNAQAHSTLFL